MAKASLIMFVECVLNKELILRCQDGLFYSYVENGVDKDSYPSIRSLPDM
jgi:hypothetical protein